MEKISDKFEALNVNSLTLPNTEKLKSLHDLGAIVGVTHAMQFAS